MLGIPAFIPAGNGVCVVACPPLPAVPTPGAPMVPNRLAMFIIGSRLAEPPEGTAPPWPPDGAERMVDVKGKSE